MATPEILSQAPQPTEAPGPTTGQVQGTESTRDMLQLGRCEGCRELFWPDELLTLEGRYRCCLDCIGTRTLLEGPGGVVVLLEGPLAEMELLS